MGKYLLKRLLHGLFSIIIVVAIVMILIFSLLDRGSIFSNDPAYSKKSGNQRIIYEYQQWQKYGYVEFTQYNDYVNELKAEGKITDDEAKLAMNLGLTARDDTEIVAEYVQKFTKYYESKGYTVERLNGKTTSTGIQNPANMQQLFAYRDLNLLTRLWDFFKGVITID